ncbi:MAG: hypothetical protein AMS27_12470 [Bacteroides sp. SM23_62_1]|nr:MAG: hypothetical protein AMS27_12470 [Bacteroides sp. SM23_62_1]
MKNRLVIIILTIFLTRITGQAQEVYSFERAPFSTRAYDEYAPVYYQDGLIFSANKRMDMLRKIDGNKGKPPWNIFVVSQTGESEWGRVDLLSDNLRSLTYEGPVTINQGQDLIYFNRNHEAGNRKMRSKVGIFSAEFINGEWTNIQPFEHNDPLYNFFHPTLSHDGNMLFFASDLRGGYGGFDLYVCTRSGTTWSEPFNLGPNVNTSGNDIYPVIHPDGRLYFSSNRHPGIGGYDIFYTEEVNGEWVEPVNVGEPFNSRRNDASLISNNDYTHGFFTSNRDRISNNIFEFKLTAPTFEECKLQEENNYCYTFFETGTMDIDTTSFMYEWRIGQHDRIRAKEADYCFPGPGDYVVQLNVIDLLTGEILVNQAYHELTIEDIEQVYITSPDTVLAGQEINFNGTRTYLKNFNVDRYYWDMGDYTRTSNPELDHRFTRPGIYTVKLGVTNDADNPEELQKACSFKRIIVLPPSE